MIQNTHENQAKNKHTHTPGTMQGYIYGRDTVGNDNFIIFASSHILRNDHLFFLSDSLSHCSTFVTFHISLSIEWQLSMDCFFFLPVNRDTTEGGRARERETKMRCCYGGIGHSPLHYTYINKQPMG